MTRVSPYAAALAAADRDQILDWRISTFYGAIVGVGLFYIIHDHLRSPMKVSGALDIVVFSCVTATAAIVGMIVAIAITQYYNDGILARLRRDKEPRHMP